MKTIKLNICQYAYLLINFYLFHYSIIGIDCEVRVKDAILEKCEGVEVLHLVVNRTSQEGCVYVKCTSPTEAGKAYKQLHGFWYDGM